MKLKIDGVAVLAALRTAGALMVGNVFVAAILRGNRNWHALGSLLAFGFGVILTASLAEKE